MTIGMPIRNGEKTVSTAIRSLLLQTYPDFVLRISDNASEDNTDDICRSMAYHDGRISYSRREVDIGAVANFNGLLDEAKGEFFMWAACDDYWDKHFLERTLDRMASESDAVACAVGAELVDREGRIVERYSPPSGLSHRSARQRVRAALSRGGFCAIYGLYRITQIPSDCRLSDIWSPDQAFVFSLALRRRIVVLDEMLFRYTWSDFETNRRRSAKDVALYAEPRPISLFAWMFSEVSVAPLHLSERIGVYWEIARAARTDWRGRLLTENIEGFRAARRSHKYPEMFLALMVHAFLMPSALVQYRHWKRLVQEALPSRKMAQGGNRPSE